jgi:drug/metabolite transporter (DMT)-like permease
MLSGILLAVATGALWGGVGIVMSLVAARNIDYISFIFCNALLASLLSWMIFPEFVVLKQSGFKPHIAITLIMMGAGMALMIGMYLINMAMRRGHHGIAWTIGQSSLVIPFLFGLIVLQENSSWFKSVGVLLIIGSLALFGRAQNSEESKQPGSFSVWLFLVLSAFFLFGLQQIATILPSYFGRFNDTAALRIPLQNTGRLAGAALLLVFTSRTFSLKGIPYALILAAIGLTSQILFFKAMDTLAQFESAGLTYPLAIGTNLTLFAAYSIVIRKEVNGLLHLGGIVLGIVGIVLVGLPAK